MLYSWGEERNVKHNNFDHEPDAQTSVEIQWIWTLKKSSSVYAINTSHPPFYQTRMAIAMFLSWRNKGQKLEVHA